MLTFLLNQTNKMTQAKTLAIGVLGLAGIWWLFAEDDDDDVLWIEALPKPQRTDSPENVPGHPGIPDTPNWAVMSSPLETAVKKILSHPPNLETSAEMVIVREVEELQRSENVYPDTIKSFSSLLERVMESATELKKYQNQTANEPSHSGFQQLAEMTRRFRRQYFGSGKTVYQGMEEWCTALIKGIVENEQNSNYPPQGPVSPSEREQYRLRLINFMKNIQRDASTVEKVTGLVEDRVREFQASEEPLNQKLQYELTDYQEADSAYQNLPVTPPRKPKPRFDEPEGFSTYRPPASRFDSPGHSDVSSVDLGSMDERFDSYKPVERLSKIDEIRSSPSGRRYKVFTQESAETRKQMLKDQGIVTPPTKPRPKRPPTQVGLATRKSLDAFRIRIKMAGSKIEAARGDRNRVELAKLMEEVESMVPAGYTETSWSEVAKYRHDLYTEDEEGKPGSRVRYEDLKDDPYFQDYRDLIQRLDNALEEFNIKRPQTPPITSL